MRITKDKFNETKHHCRNLFNKFNDVKSSKDTLSLIKLIDVIRYDLNNFINSFRATTFALQSEHRSKNKEIFEDWYQAAIKPLINSKYSNLFKEIRNVNQKNGNAYFSFIISYTTKKTKIYYDLNFADKNNDFLKPTRVEFIEPLQIPISNGTDASINEADKELVFENILKEVIVFNKNLDKESLFNIEKIKLIDQEFSIVEFREIVNIQMNILQDIISSGDKIFK